MNNITRISIVSGPLVEPISTAEAKTHLRVDTSTEDSYIDGLITISRQLCEQYTNRAFITQTWKLFLDKWPISQNKEWWSGVKELPVNYEQDSGSIDLPKAPLQSVTHIKTYNDEDTATTFSSSNYYVSTYSGDEAPKGRITLRRGQVWPTFERVADGIEIQFVCGYGDAGSDVPRQIRRAIEEEVAYRYEHRGDKLDFTTVMSDTALSLLENFRDIKV